MCSVGFRHAYGPVPSRRLGRSLGVNPIPFQTGNYRCVYCQLGRTSRGDAAHAPATRAVRPDTRSCGAL